MKLTNTISLGTVLQIANIGICALTQFLYLYNGDNQYINKEVILAVIFIHLQIFYILRYEKKHPNPFLILLSYIVIHFYLLRITTLISQDPPISLVFSRPGAEDIGGVEIFNFLVFMFFSIWAIFIGHMIRFKYNAIHANNSQKTGQEIKFFEVQLILYFGVMTIFFLLYCQYLMEYFSINYLLIGILSNTFDYLKMTVLMVIALLLLPQFGRWRVLSRYLILITSLIFIMIIFGGSGGPMLRVGIFLACAILAVKFRIVIKQKTLIVILVALVSTTFFGTFLKFNRGIDVSQKIEILSDSFNDSGFNFLYYQIAARAGFLDMSVELIHNQEYSKLINFEYYIESLVDSFTPGFDIYDSPPVSNALRAIYLGMSKLSRQDVQGAYHSDQLNCFAEYYILFGPFLAILMFALSGHIFTIAFTYCRFRVRNRLIGLFLAATVLTSYYGWLKSFGLDWSILELVFSIYFILFIKFLFLIFGALQKKSLNIVAKN